MAGFGAYGPVVPIHDAGHGITSLNEPGVPYRPAYNTIESGATLAQNASAMLNCPFSNCEQLELGINEFAIPGYPHEAAKVFETHSDLEEEYRRYDVLMRIYERCRTTASKPLQAKIIDDASPPSPSWQVWKSPRTPLARPYMRFDRHTPFVELRRGDRLNGLAWLLEEMHEEGVAHGALSYANVGAVRAASDPSVITIGGMRQVTSPFSKFAPESDEKKAQADVVAALADDDVHVKFDRRIVIRGPMVGGIDRGTLLRAMVDGHNKFIDAAEGDEMFVADVLKVNPPLKHRPQIIGQFEEAGGYVGGGYQGRVYDNLAKTDMIVKVYSDTETAEKDARAFSVMSEISRLDPAFVSLEVLVKGMDHTKRLHIQRYKDTLRTCLGTEHAWTEEQLHALLRQFEILHGMGAAHGDAHDKNIGLLERDGTAAFVLADPTHLAVSPFSQRNLFGLYSGHTAAEGSERSLVTEALRKVTGSVFGRTIENTLGDEGTKSFLVSMGLGDTAQRVELVDTIIREHNEVSRKMHDDRRRLRGTLSRVRERGDHHHQGWGFLDVNWPNPPAVTLRRRLVASTRLDALGEIGGLISRGLRCSVYTHPRNEGMVVKVYDDEAYATSIYSGLRVLQGVSKLDPTFLSLKAELVGTGYTQRMLVEKYDTNIPLASDVTASHVHALVRQFQILHRSGVAASISLSDILFVGPKGERSFVIGDVGSLSVSPLADPYLLDDVAPELAAILSALREHQKNKELGVGAWIEDLQSDNQIEEFLKRSKLAVTSENVATVMRVVKLHHDVVQLMEDERSGLSESLSRSRANNDPTNVAWSYLDEARSRRPSNPMPRPR
jgi:hypothetical protein